MRLSSQGLIAVAIFGLSVLLLTTYARAEDSAFNYFVDGVEVFEDGDYEEAFRLFEKAIDLEPENLEFRYYLGHTFKALKKDKDALEIFKSIIEKDPVNFVKAFFDIAGIYNRQKNHQKALDTLTYAGMIHPENSRIHLEMGRTCRQLKDYEQAVQYLNRAKEIDPNLSQVVFYDLGAVYLDLEQFDLSEEMFEKSVQVNPKTDMAENARQAILNVRAAKGARKPWYLLASLTLGYDDNIPLDPIGSIVNPAPAEGMGKGDHFQNLFLKGGYKFVNQKDFEIGAGYSLYCIGYEDWIINNVLQHRPHLYLRYDKKPYYFRIQYDFSYFYTGGNESNDNRLFTLTFGDDSDSKLRMHSLVPSITILEANGMKSDIIFAIHKKEYLDHTTPDSTFYSAGFVQSFKIPDMQCYPRLGYRYGYEDSRDERASYRLHEGHAGLAASLYWGIDADLSMNYMRITYEGFLASGNRHDRNYVIAVSLSKLFFERMRVQALYHYNHNNSDVSEPGPDPYKFKKNIYLLSMSYVF